MTGRRISYIKFHVPAVTFVILERLLNGLMKEQNNTNAASRIVTRILDYEHNYDAENEITNKR